MEIFTALFPNGIASSNFFGACILLFVVAWYNRETIHTLVKNYITGEEINNKKPKKSHNDDRDNSKLEATVEKLSDNIESIKNDNRLMRDDINTKMNQFENNLNEKINVISNRLTFLTESDAVDKRAYIIEKYMKHVERGEPMDIVTLDNINKIYDTYLKENGDTYVKDLMSRLRRLEISKHIANDIDTHD